MARPTLDSFVSTQSKPSLSSFVAAQPKTQLPDTSTKADQATFQANGSEGVLGTIGNVVGNIPSSAIQFAKSTFDFLNPLNTIHTASNLGTALGDSSQTKVSPLDVAAEIPHEVYKTLTPQFLQHAISGDYQKASATLQNDPIGQILPILFVGRKAAEKAGVGAQFDNAVSSVASPVTNTVSAVATKSKSVAGGAAKFGSSQLTGFSPQTLEQVISNPQEFSKTAQSSITRPALAENIRTALSDRQSALQDTGAGYGGVRTMTAPIPVSPTYLSDLIKNTTKLQVGMDISSPSGSVTGKLKADGNSSIRIPGDVSALQTKLYDTWQPEFAKGYLTPEQFLNFRSDLSKIAYNDNGIKSGDLAKVGETMRAKANADLRQHIPGLESIDTSYAPQISELQQLSKGLVDTQGNLSDAAINRIANSTGKGKDPQLARLEQLSPGITDKIRILKAVEDIQNSRENKPGTYLRAGALGAGLVTMNPYLIVSAIMSLPEVSVPLLRGLGYSSDMISQTLKTLGIPETAKKINNSISNNAKKIPIVPSPQQVPKQ